MRTIFTVLFMLFTLSALAQDLPENPEAYFDFWLGRWEATWDEGEGKKGRGSNHIHKVLDGKVIQEDFQILEGKNKGFKGMSISTYQTQLKTWKQSWADNQSSFFYFKGKFEGAKRIFQTDVFDGKEGVRFTQRMIFYAIEEDSFTWDWESSQDGGNTWKLNWRIFYTRAKEKNP
ncbi:MAG: DUF1579 family protein [Bacteroidota bacterium]